MKLNVLVFTTTITLLLSSCYYDNFGELKPDVVNNTVSCDTVTVISYSNQIVPLLAASCTGGCHNSIGPGHNMINYASLNADALSGSLLGSIKWTGSYRRMPEASTTKISDCDIAKVRLWIAQGSLNN